MPLDNNQTPFAIAKLDEAVRGIKQVVNELPILRKRLDKNKDNKLKAKEIYNDLQQQYGKLISALNSVTLSLLEMELPDETDYSIKLKQSIKSFNLMTPDYSKLCLALNNFLAKLPVSNTPEMITTNAAVIGRLMKHVKMGYYPTDLEHAKHLVRGIEFPEGITTNLFDPCCGCGLALRTLAEGNNCYTYGVELDGHRSEEALTRLHRVGFGSYFQSRISNEAFHLMLLNPPYLSVMTEGGLNTRSEKKFLVNSLTHLIYGGLIIYIIPYYRLTADICRILCDNFDDLSVWKFMGDEFKRFKQVAVMGIRRKRQDGSDMVSSLASLALEPDNIPLLMDIPDNRYQLPPITKKVELFKGAEFNVVELAEQLHKSTSFSKLFEKNKLDSSAKRPLLPLNLGQVGLIGGSGLINGLVDCDTPHIIKGRIVKDNKVNIEENINNRGDVTSTTVYETRSNKMIFNLLTPQGFLSLSDYSDIGMNIDTNVNEYKGERSMETTSVRLNEESNFEVIYEPESIFDDYANTITVYESEDNEADKVGLRIPLGRMVITPNANNTLSGMEINAAIARHRSGDWGEVGKSDWKANNDAVKEGERVLSVYTGKGGDKFWIITEADRSYTTVLMPNDY
jgi:hypothetical protein